MTNIKYNYTDGEYQVILEQIKRNYNINPLSNNKPKLIFAAGQPGSGKSTLPKKIQIDYSDINFAIIDMDQYRLYHPKIKEIEVDNVDFVQETNQFSMDIEEDIIKYCLSCKQSFIHIGTMRDFKFVHKFVINTAKEQGYDIEIYALAVSNQESKTSALLREKQQRKQNENLFRKTSESFIDIADNGFKESIKILSTSSAISNIKILIRGKSAEEVPIIVYNQNEDTARKYYNAYEALIKIREMQECTEKEHEDDIYR